MTSVLKSNNPMNYYIGYERVAAMDRMKKADFMVAFAPSIKEFCKEVASIIDALNLVQIPMTWSMYPDRVWNPMGCPAVPCVKIDPTYSDILILSQAYEEAPHSPIKAFFRGRYTLTVMCEPCWESYKRWGDIIVEDFFKAMLAVKQHYGFSKWNDGSEPSVRYGDPKYIYSSPIDRPLKVARIPFIEPVNKYGELIDEQVVEMGVSFYLQLPATPEKDKNSANCHVVEETVTETVTKTVKRIKCY